MDYFNGSKSTFCYIASSMHVYVSPLDESCLYVCMYVCIYVYVYVFMYVYIYVCMYVCVYMYMYLCMYVCMYVQLDGTLPLSFEAYYVLPFTNGKIGAMRFIFFCDSSIGSA